MAENGTGSLKSLSELEGIFNVPDYQRGYRWGKSQITTFLEDIKKACEAGERQYFLQAVVVKQTGGTKDKPEWELIDGQQRLTTAWLLSKVLAKYLHKAKHLAFNLTYQTRPGSKEFLERLVSSESELPDQNHNVDYWYMAQAARIMESWADKEEDVASLRGYLHTKVKVLWHEDGPDVDPAKHFVSLNSGRISLLDAELCRAVLLAGKNMDIEYLIPKQFTMPKTEADKYVAGQLRANQIRNRQLLIGNAWDRVERELRETALWGFLNGASDQAVYMNYLLQIVFNKTDNDGQHPCYGAIESRLKNKPAKADAVSIWNDILFRFDRLQSWFDNNNYYHWLGYLSALRQPDTTISFWHKQLESSISESEDKYKDTVFGEIRKSVTGSSDKLDLILENFNYSNSEQTKNLLLLFNVEYARRSRSLGVRFPFHKHNGMTWSLEHINAQKLELTKDQKVWREWLKMHRNFLAGLNDDVVADRAAERDSLVKRIAQLLADRDIGSAEFEALRDEVVDFIGSNSIRQDELCNLALLDVSENAALGNAHFAVKRKILKDWLARAQDAENPEAGSFYIPLGTQAAFMRHFTDEETCSLIWTETDMEGYMHEIGTALALYWPGSNTQPKQGE